MIPIPQIPTEEIRLIRLSESQWAKLVVFIDPNTRTELDVAKQNLDYVVRTYFCFTFIIKQSMTPSGFAKPFKKLITLLDELYPFLENHFFPSYYKWPDNFCSELVRDRLSGSSSISEKALIKEEPKERVKNDYNINQRNEFIRYMMTLYVNGESKQLKLPHIQMEALLANVHGLRSASKKILEKLPSAKGKHGDRNFLRFIFDVQNIYRDAGGRGLYTPNAESFLRLLMEYVVDLSRLYIGEDHVRSLNASVEGDNLKEQVKKARRYWGGRHGAEVA